MNAAGARRQPESTYQLLLDAAGTWPDGAATQWIPDSTVRTGASPAPATAAK